MPLDEFYRVRAARPWIRWSAALAASAVVAIGAARVARATAPLSSSIPSVDAVPAGIVDVLDRAVQP